MAQWHEAEAFTVESGRPPRVFQRNPGTQTVGNGRRIEREPRCGFQEFLLLGEIWGDATGERTKDSDL